MTQLVLTCLKVNIISQTKNYLIILCNKNLRPNLWWKLIHIIYRLIDTINYLIRFPKCTIHKTTIKSYNITYNHQWNSFALCTSQINWNSISWLWIMFAINTQFTHSVISRFLLRAKRRYKNCSITEVFCESDWWCL